MAKKRKPEDLLADYVKACLRRQEAAQCLQGIAKALVAFGHDITAWNEQERPLEDNLFPDGTVLVKGRSAEENYRIPVPTPAEVKEVMREMTDADEECWRLSQLLRHETPYKFIIQWQDEQRYQEGPPAR